MRVLEAKTAQAAAEASGNRDAIAASNRALEDAVAAAAKTSARKAAASHGRKPNQQKHGFDVVFLASPRFPGIDFDAVVGPDGKYFQATASKDQRDALLASAPAVVDAVKGKQLQFAVKKRTDGDGACCHGATGYTLSNEALKKLGFCITKWKHIVPLPEGNDADKHEDAVAWIDIPVA